jgi:SAM-dependent methyltransferase
MTEVAPEELETEKRRRMARWLSGSGIEIGALHHPLSVPDGVQVRYVDRMPESELRRHYKELEGQSFAPISIIGNAQDLSNIEDGTVDFVIANHLVEHLDNPIRGLEEMVRALRPGGVLYLALPDPRVTFDFERQLTSVEHLVDEYRNGADQTRETHFREWVERAEPHTHFGTAENVDQRVQTLLQMDYSIHYHLWRPDTFLDFLAAARHETGMELELVDFAACDHGKDNEFIFVFLKGIAATPVANPPFPPSGDEATPAPPTTPTEVPANSWITGIKRRLGDSPLGPVLRPVYRAGRQLLKR